MMMHPGARMYYSCSFDVWGSLWDVAVYALLRMVVWKPKLSYACVRCGTYGTVCSRPTTSFACGLSSLYVSLSGTAVVYTAIVGDAVVSLDIH